VDNSLVQGALASYYYDMNMEDYFIQTNAKVNTKIPIRKNTHGKREHHPELYMTNPDLYLVRGNHVGMWTPKLRKENYYKLARLVGVTQAFVTNLFKKEKETGRKVDVGTKIRNKAGLNRPKRKEPFNTATLTKRMNKIKTHRATCTANRTPLCLKVFVTNTEDTVCLRCQNI